MKLKMEDLLWALEESEKQAVKALASAHPLDREEQIAAEAAATTYRVLRAKLEELPQ